MPDLNLRFTDTYWGGLITASFFVVGKVGISLYIGQSAIGLAYGAAGSLVIILVWVYDSSLILFLGAEICWVVFTDKETRIETKKNKNQLK